MVERLRPTPIGGSIGEAMGQALVVRLVEGHTTLIARSGLCGARTMASRPPARSLLGLRACR